MRRACGWKGDIWESRSPQTKHPSLVITHSLTAPPPSYQHRNRQLRQHLLNRSRLHLISLSLSPSLSLFFFFCHDSVKGDFRPPERCIVGNPGRPMGCRGGNSSMQQKSVAGGVGLLVCNPRRKVFYSTDFQFYWFNVQWGSLTSTAPTPQHTHLKTHTDMCKTFRIYLLQQTNDMFQYCGFFEKLNKKTKTKLYLCIIRWGSVLGVPYSFSHMFS